jgi:Cys-tRNA(Pro)/Cys-tRNA(Cys) deacylase
MKKHFPTYIHHTCNEYPYIFVSAGVRGLQLKIAPADLLNMTQAMAVEGLGTVLSSVQ